MSLPRINPTRLQQVVFQIEMSRKLSFDDLCFAVAGTNWAEEMELEAETIGKLIVAHDIITKAAKPEGTPEPKASPQKTPPLPVESTPPPAPATTEVVNTFKEGGRGRKQCPACKLYIGARVAKCACGHEFLKKESAPKADPKPSDAPAPKPTQETLPRVIPVDRHSYPNGTVCVPAGKPPVNLTGSDEGAVLKWAEEMRAVWEKRGQLLSAEALFYFVMMYYDGKGEDLKEARPRIKSILRTNYPNEGLK